MDASALNALSLWFLLILFVLQLGWNIYLFYQNKILVNKLMSRNYHEFKLAENVGKKEESPKTEPVEDAYFEQRARELNGLFGMGQ